MQARNCKPLPAQEAYLKHCTKGGAPVSTQPGPAPKIGGDAPYRAAPDPHGFRERQAKQGY